MVKVLNWAKIEEEVRSAEMGVCTTKYGDDNVTRYSCFVCGSKPSQPCGINDAVLKGDHISRDWCISYLRAREAAKEAARG